ncbi:hypothetical protein BME96_12420 [Virgibacillus halodenitrificans]|uniref:Peptidase M15 n=1 Tax=Virgibacillus halodenitrificans TaxID=1482 RepID=A0AAC9J1T9_VIRHA|nr:peptidoglycan-binding protein [Virgibacillus halodenitrificans]APC48948.1 hypothetical protein BME96_12420 [Virgibacillus halodenitrificans]
MTVSLQTLLDRSNRNMDKGTHPVVRDKALELIKRAYKERIYVQISEGYRSHARQQALYDQGRTTPGNIVTNAKPGQSIHNYGTAVDFFLVSDDGQDAIWKVDKKWRRAAAIGKSLGFEWGGDWKSFKDYPHLQMPNISSGKPSTPSYGNSKVIIKKIQTYANKYYNAGLRVDGYDGPKTRKALLKAYQTELNKQFDRGLVKDGVWGPKTENASIIVYPGAKGRLTWIIQALLYCKGYDPKGLDGIFGSGCEATVREFQESEGLVVDGRVGPVTFKHLFK